MKRSLLLTLTISLVAAAPALAAGSSSLRGSRASMERQHGIAEELDYTFLQTPEQVQEFVEEGRLVELKGNDDYRISEGVSFPYARPELLVFVERLGAQYRASCGEPLVVTSVTRPVARQPANASRLSVHPAGMALDLRISEAAACRGWLEETLLSLEQKDLLDVTRERNPPHYHVAVFPTEYAAYVAQLKADSVRLAETAAAPAPAVTAPAAVAPSVVESEDRSNGLIRFAIEVALSMALILIVAKHQPTGRRARA